MTMPKQKPGRSRQDYGTPADFLAAVKHRLGITEFVVDLAATAENAKARRFITPEVNSLTFDWGTYRTGWCWLNPPFRRIVPWVGKAHASQMPKAGEVVLTPDWAPKPFVMPPPQVAMLVPAAVGANWWRDHVDGVAYVLLLNGRLTFGGESDPYPKDCALLLYGMNPGYEVWDWRKELGHSRQRTRPAGDAHRDAEGARGTGDAGAVDLGRGLAGAERIGAALGELRVAQG